MVPYLELIRIEIFKDVSKLWQDGLLNFLERDTKLDWFLAKTQLW